jgi:energy-coupling factor transport system permease protein
MRLVPVYRVRSSPLHAAGAGATAALCSSLALVCVLFEHPLVLAAVIAAVIGAGAAAGVGSEIARSVRFAIPFALLVTVINPLVYTGGETLLVRGFTVLGHRFDITLEAVAAGGLAGLRLGALVLAFGLFSACVDPDALLRLFRRLSYRSALTATLATRLVPVLARDATRMGDAVRCRAEPPGRLAVGRAAVAGALERAVDVAAALEVRGYSAAVRPARERQAWSRHDVRVAAGAAAVAGGAIALWIAGVGRIESYPSLDLSSGGGELALVCLLLLATALPFAGRAARLGVARG